MIAFAKGGDGANPFERSVGEADGVAGQLAVVGDCVDFHIAVIIHVDICNILGMRGFPACLPPLRNRIGPCGRSADLPP